MWISCDRVHFHGFLLGAAPVIELPVQQLSLHQVNVLVAGRTFATQGARLLGLLNQNVLEEEIRGGERFFQEVEMTTTA